MFTGLLLLVVISKTKYWLKISIYYQINIKMNNVKEIGIRNCT